MAPKTAAEHAGTPDAHSLLPRVPRTSLMPPTTWRAPRLGAAALLLAGENAEVLIAKAILIGCVRCWSDDERSVKANVAVRGHVFAGRWSAAGSGTGVWARASGGGLSRPDDPDNLV